MLIKVLTWASSVLCILIGVYIFITERALIRGAPSTGLHAQFVGLVVIIIGLFLLVRSSKGPI